MRGDARFNYVDELCLEYAGRKDAIRQRLADFAQVPAREYPYELVYCLLTPQSSAVNAAAAVEALRQSQCWQDVHAVAGILHRRHSYIRFHNTKAHHVVRAWAQSGEITPMLCNGTSSQELRTWLVQNVRGLGWKEASHFLRNIGHRNLAILDRHILRNLTRHGVIRTLPASLPAKRYRSIEQLFIEFAKAVGIGMDELDLLFWSRETGRILK